jgi:hypothetical protein
MPWAVGSAAVFHPALRAEFGELHYEQLPEEDRKGFGLFAWLTKLRFHGEVMRQQGRGLTSSAGSSAQAHP